MSRSHILFSASAGGTLKQLLRSRGIRDEVISLHEYLDWGPIDCPLEEREAWIELHCPSEMGKAWDDGHSPDDSFLRWRLTELVRRGQLELAGDLAVQMNPEAVAMVRRV